MRQPLENEEIYHVYNRGVEKRNIFSDPYDVARFLESMKEFNMREPIGSLYQNSFRKKNNQLSGFTAKSEKLVEIIAYCLNPNHFHLILRQIADGGISEFMKRVSGGYTWYFNHKEDRSGALFQGTFKSKNIPTNVYLLHVSAYVNLNNEVHHLSKDDPLFARSDRSSWGEYVQTGRKWKGTDICVKESILGQFKNRKEYEIFARNSLQGIIERKKLRREMEALLLE
jgi:REP element-mobilizing transposase RayT